MEIRPAAREEAGAISALISSVAHFFTVHPEGEGAEKFLSTISPSAIAENLDSGEYTYFCAHIDGELAGIVATRGSTHLFHLFVAPRFHRRGIAERLWAVAREAAMERGNPSGSFTVYSTPYAVPVYERFGFEATGPRVEADGIAFVPMKLTGPGEHEPDGAASDGR